MESIQHAIIIRLRRIYRIPTYPLRYIIIRIFELSHLRLVEKISFIFFKFKCLIYGVKHGKKISVYGNLLIRGPGQIIIGNNVELNSSSWRCSSSSINSPVRLRTFSLDKNNQIIVGNRVGLQGTSITARSTIVRIGDDTLIGPNCMITDADFHQIWPPTERNNPGIESDAPVTIGQRVWIGSRCIILKGVTIGDNAVIISGSTVVNDIPTNALAGGVPAKVIKFFPDVQNIFAK